MGMSCLPEHEEGIPRSGPSWSVPSLQPQCDPRCPKCPGRPGPWHPAGWRRAGLGRRGGRGGSGAVTASRALRNLARGSGFGTAVALRGTGGRKGAGREAGEVSRRCGRPAPQAEGGSGRRGQGAGQRGRRRRREGSGPPRAQPLGPQGEKPGRRRRRALLPARYARGRGALGAPSPADPGRGLAAEPRPRGAAAACGQMTVDGSMSSGYCSLEEELEDCFFTAKTTFFRNVQSKQPSKNVCKPAEETPHPPTLQEIKQKIASYNSREKNCLGMKLSEDGTYTGFIKVHLKLRRPVTVPAGIRPQSIYDAIKEVNLAATTDKRTSFYLPLDAIKQLHISSTTTVSEVIQGLLKKFMVVDNPQKFALFKRIHKDGQVLFQKLSAADCPLYLRLLAGPDTDVLSFVLKENETGEVEWDAFSIPELQNFLTILEKEEQDKIQQVQKKYDKFRQKLEEALREAQGKPG